MEVKLKCGDTITIPKGCKAIVKDGSVEIVKVQEFKDGDVLHSVYDNTMLIFKETSKYARGYFDSHYNNKCSSNQHWNSESFRHATEEEKCQLFDNMKEKGWLWNAEKKRVETIRWRAKKGYIYHRLTCYLRSTDERDDYQTWDQKCHDSYNYFHTEEQTKEAARRVRKALRQYHEEIGE